jgi:putative ABC transport system substrate-binding protein
MSPGDIPRYDNAFLQGLQEQGYILPGEVPHYDEPFWKGLIKRGSFEGKKIRIEIRATAEDFPKRVPALAEELVRLNVDLLFSATYPEAEAARQAVQRANKTIPIVFGPQNDPVGGGLIDSLARPGGNVTGLLLTDPELEAKRLEVLLETFPRLSRVAFLGDSKSVPPKLIVKVMEAMRAAARAKSVRLDMLDVRRTQELNGAFAQITSGRAQAIMVANTPVLLGARHRIVAFAAQRRLPAMYGDALFVEAGGLMFYGSPYVDLLRRTAAIVAKILNGIKPNDIPVEQPTEFKLLINLKTAQALGVRIPESILLRAETVDQSGP